MVKFRPSLKLKLANEVHMHGALPLESCVNPYSYQ